MTELKPIQFPETFSKEVADKLAAPFEKIKWRIKTTVKGKTDGNTYGVYFAYIDSRDVADRLNDVVGQKNWSYTWTEVHTSVERYTRPAVMKKNWQTQEDEIKFPEKEVEDHKYVVKGRLTLYDSVHEDVGYYNNLELDEEPLKSAVSDALKRCGVQFGIGRFLYTLGTKLIKVDPKTKKPLDAKDLEKLENMFASTRTVAS